MHNKPIFQFLCAVVLLLAAVAGCRAEPPTGPTPPPDMNDLSTAVAHVVETAVAATATAAATGTTTAPATETPAPAPPPITGAWQREHDEEGLQYVQTIEFFGDGLFTAHIAGLLDPCGPYGLPGACQFFPDVVPQLPFEMSTSGTYEFLDARRVRLAADNPGEPAPFLPPPFGRQLSAFDVDLPDADTLLLVESGVAYRFGRIR